MCFCASLWLESESDLRVDATVVSRIAAAEASKATSGRRRLPKQQRAQVADRICEVRVIQQVVEIHRERQVVPAIAAATRPAKTTSARSAKTTTASSTAATRATAGWTTASHTAAHHRRVSSVALLITLLI